MRSIGLPELIVLAVVLIPLLLLPAILYLFTLQRAIERCAPQSRTISPGNIWMLLVPLFNVGYHFVVVSSVAQTLANEYALRRIPIDDPQPGRGVGLAMCILTVCSVIPFLGILTGMAAMVCWITYWVKIFGYSGALIAPAPYGQAVTTPL